MSAWPSGRLLTCTEKKLNVTNARFCARLTSSSFDCFHQSRRRRAFAPTAMAASPLGMKSRESSGGRGSLRLCDILRTESTDHHNGAEHVQEVKLAQLSRHKAFSYGLPPNISEHDSDSDTSYGFPGMNCMLSRVGVQFVESGSKDPAPGSGNSLRERPDAKTTQTINVTDIGDDHLQALEAACIEHQHALTPFISGQRPLQELVCMESRALETEMHIIALQQYLDILCAYSEILQLQGRVDVALQCILSCGEVIDLFLAAHVGVNSPSSVALTPCIDADLVEKIDSILFSPSYLDKIGRSGIDYWWRVGLAHTSLTKYLANFLKRVGVLLRQSGHTSDAYCVVKLAMELYKHQPPNGMDTVVQVTTAMALLVSILIELGEESEAARLERAALGLVASSASPRTRHYPSPRFEE